MEAAGGFEQERLCFPWGATWRETAADGGGDQGRAGADETAREELQQFGDEGKWPSLMTSDQLSSFL